MSDEIAGKIKADNYFSYICTYIFHICGNPLSGVQSVYEQMTQLRYKFTQERNLRSFLINFILKYDN